MAEAEALPSATYLPEGPQVGVPVVTLTAGGWTLCHQELYSNVLDNTQFEEIQDTCHGEKVFLGCKRVGADRLTVAAWGRRTTVFTDVTDEDYACKSNCKSKKEEGTNWYRTSKTWGFAAQENNLYLHSADVGDTHGPAPQSSTAGTRLSWMAYGKWGGYRCRTDENLGNSNYWEKVFFHAN